MLRVSCQWFVVYGSSKVVKKRFPINKAPVLLSGTYPTDSGRLSTDRLFVEMSW